ncbi:2-hydroxyglutaryl-CoA dehydratase [bacterium]|nr:2-hydroxyglutaryl-CoA dehydratase [bacterium]
MTIVAGCDVGSLTTKAVLLKDNRLISTSLIRSKAKPQESARIAMEELFAKADLSEKEMEYCVGTGYGREKLAFVNAVKSEIACHGKGAKWLLPSVKTIIDIGGQDCKVIKIDESGTATRFVTNDKCASGTGRFLEVMAQVLGIDISELGQQSSRSKSPVTLASTCTVWAQADVIKQINSGVPIEDIGAGINLAMAKRIATLANSIKPENDICMTGGVAKNQGVMSLLEQLMGCRIRKIRKSDPQLAGAIGAALFAQEKLLSA